MRLMGLMKIPSTLPPSTCDSEKEENIGGGNDVGCWGGVSGFVVVGLVWGLVFGVWGLGV